MFKLVFRLAVVISIFAGSFFITAHAQSFFTATPQNGGSNTAAGTSARRMITVEEFQQNAKQSIDAAKQSLNQQIQQQKQLLAPPSTSESASKNAPVSTPGQLSPPTTTSTATTNTPPTKPQDTYTGFKPVNPSNTGTTTTPNNSSTGGSGNTGGWSIKY